MRISDWSSDVCSSDLTCLALGVAPANLSFHLSHLSQAGLIVQRREGRSLIYSAAYDRMSAVIGFLTENCCGLPGNSAACTPTCAATPEVAGAETQREADRRASARLPRG